MVEKRLFRIAVASTKPTNHHPPQTYQVIGIRQLSSFGRMQITRLRRQRSHSKGRSVARGSVTVGEMSAAAFGVGALVVVILWAWLQAHTERVLQARAFGIEGSQQAERCVGTVFDSIFGLAPPVFLFPPHLSLLLKRTHVSLFECLAKPWRG